MYDYASSKGSNLGKILTYVFFLFIALVWIAQAQIPTAEKELLVLAKKSFKEKKFSESLIHFSKLLRVNRRNIIYVFNYGVVCAELGRNSEALEYFSQVVDSDSELKYLALFYVAELSRRKGDMFKAKRILVTLSKKENLPEKLRSQIFRELLFVSEQTHEEKEFVDLINLGIKRYQDEKFLEANSYWGAAYHREPSWELEILVGITNWKLNKKDAARGYWKRVYDGSDDKELERTTKELLKL